MSYRPIDTAWFLARPKVKYYGSFPNGFLERARALLGVSLDDSVLHVCAGRVRDYPIARGFGPNDKTLDINYDLEPDFLVRDVLKEIPRLPSRGWAAILADPPYTLEDAHHYGSGSVLPNPSTLLNKCLKYVRPGGRVGMLHYVIPRPADKRVKFVAVAFVVMGYGNRVRAFSVFERPVKAIREEANSD